MLKLREQENIILMFFVAVLILVGIYVVIDRNIIDIIYLAVILIYFIKFLIVRFRKN